MKKTDNTDNFLDTIFDNDRYLDEVRELTNNAKRVEEAIIAITDEGIAVNLQFINDVSNDEGYFRDYITNLENEYLKRVKFIPKTEKIRVKQNFESLYEQLNPSITEIRRAISNGMPFETEKGKVVVDYSKMEEKAKELATSYTDVVSMEKYYNKIDAVNKAINNLRAFEIENELPDFRGTDMNGGLWYSVGTNVRRTDYNGFYSDNPTKERFSFISRDYFKKDKPK